MDMLEKWYIQVVVPDPLHWESTLNALGTVTHCQGDRLVAPQPACTFCPRDPTAIRLEVMGRCWESMKLNVIRTWAKPDA